MSNILAVLTGHGKFTWSDGEVYEGEFKDCNRHGQGKMTYADGAVYEGAWEHGERHGQGKLTDADGDVYEGAWENGWCHGQGKYTYVNGEVYEGAWKKGKRHGDGKYTHPSGAAYEGAWKNGKRHGQGKYTDTDGRVIEGDWDNGKLMPPMYHLYLHRAVDEAGSDDPPEGPDGLGLYKLGYKLGAKGKRSRQSDYDIVGEWPVAPKGSTKAKRRRVMKAVESVFIDSLELREAECQAACEDEFWLYNETAKAAAAKAAAAAAAGVVTAHDAPQEQA